MEIKMHQEMTINADQRAYLERKAGRLKKLAGRFWNPAAFVSIEIRGNKVADLDRAVHCSLKMPLPGETLYASAEAKTVEASMDQAEDKIVHQIEKYKGRHA